jgi:tRNA-specific 2-thiouridylase
MKNLGLPTVALSQQAPTKVLLGISGNLRSSVVAALLKHQGFQVIGLHFKVDAKSQEDAEAVAKKLGLMMIVEDATDLVQHYVVDHVVHAALANLQPESDYIAHQRILIEGLCAKAKAMNCTKVATGHEARVALEPSTGLTRLLRAADPERDQSHLLFGLKMEDLTQFILPIGDLTGAAIERLSVELELDIEKLKNPGAGFCHISREEVAMVAEARLPESLKIPGQITSTDGNVIGEHLGLFRYYRGQTAGLPPSPSKTDPYVVVDMNSSNHNLVLGFEGTLLKSEAIAHRVNWIQKVDPIKALICEAQLSPRRPPVKCKVTQFQHQYLQVEFDKPQKNVVPGQAIVFYAGDEVLGGAFAV